MQKYNSHKKKAKVAAIQMCSSPIVEENLSTAAHLIKSAAENKADLVVLPEMFAIMGINAIDKLLNKETFKSGTIQSFISIQAKVHKLWIVGGTLPLECSNPCKVRAASLVFNPKGELVARYDKVHLFDVALNTTETYKESESIEAGDSLVIVDTPFGKIGLAVCYDLRFPELFRYLFNQGAEILCVPAAFTIKTGKSHWELLTRCRAVDTFSYLIGAAQGGTHPNGRQTYGHSLIVSPWGEVISQIDGTQPGVIYADIDLEILNVIRQSIPTKNHQRILLDAHKFTLKKN